MATIASTAEPHLHHGTIGGHTMPFGTVMAEGGGVEFRLWAPNAKTVDVMIASQPGAEDTSTATSAKRGDGGWFTALIADAAAGTRYKFRIDGDLQVPDPASRYNPKGPHGASVVVDPNAFDWDGDSGWKGRPWHEAVIYELHVGTFTTEGTFAAAQARLQWLADTGITAVQLMPLADFPGDFGWGYDGVLPYAPHASYGSPDDLKRFVQAAHRLGLMVMLDVVYNHFGPDGNFLHAYAPQFFSEKHHTAWGAGINFDGKDSVPVREFFIHNALYWLHEFRMDGLRFDAVHAMLDDETPDIMESLSLRVRSHVQDREVHLVLENDSNDATRLDNPATAGRFDGQWNGDFHHTLHVLLTGEGDGYYSEYTQVPREQLARVMTQGFARQGGPHNSEHAKPREAADSVIPLGSSVNFLQNHDQIGNRAFGDRLITLSEDSALRLSTAICLLCPPPPLLFMGEEFGATTPFLYFSDWSGDLAKAVTEGRRKEFSQFPRFSDPEVQSRIPDPCTRSTFDACKLDWSQADSPSGKAWRATYANLLSLRRNVIEPRLPGLVTGGHEAVMIGQQVLRVRWRFEPKGQPASVLEMTINLGEESVLVPFTPIGGALPTPATSHLAVYFVGHIAVTPHGDRFGAWAGRWQWLSLDGEGRVVTSPAESQAMAGSPADTAAAASADSSPNLDIHVIQP
ncbi:MAG: malto-oligosyltrehalose trehalohydrolase [Rhizobacter sp.]|nr:malto-oligosyltrehalose trehalohydrolase [Rhizobacter sp.]